MGGAIIFLRVNIYPYHPNSALVRRRIKMGWSGSTHRFVDSNRKNDPTGLLRRPTKTLRVSGSTTKNPKDREVRSVPLDFGGTAAPNEAGLLRRADRASSVAAAYRSSANCASTPPLLSRSNPLSAW
jgi:hypothetical protein